MPWIGNVSGVLAAWYPGIGGAEAIANILFGNANPSARLPISFAKTDADLPEPTVPGIDPKTNKAVEDMSTRKDRSFDAIYSEGLAVGYKWYEVKHREPLFAFGHGLSYTTFQYSGLKVNQAAHTAEFQLKNVGKLAGAEVAQLYVTLPASSEEPFQRLAAWKRVQLAPGESRTITLPLNPAYLSIFDVAADQWKLLPGEYKLAIGGASDDVPIKGRVTLGDTP
jgi:beta-glucosidase